MDEEIICVECRQPFIFTEGEQRAFAKLGYQDPKRCLECRRKRKKNKAKQFFRERGN